MSTPQEVLQQTQSNLSEIRTKYQSNPEGKKMDPQQEHWFRAHWRPAMGWTYMIICIFDFIIAPAYMLLLPLYTKIPYIAWKSLTLENGGLIHLAFGAILGVTAWTRGNEKLANIAVSSPQK